ncbi:MAG: Tim44 domain-containing protein [Desulfobacteraceae bacterium]|nr:Tim44 domain-containing protein [Desulfobacteraceae bacterium]
MVDTVDARSKRGGRSFKSAQKKTHTQTVAPTKKKSGSFMKGLAGGLLGGAIGSMLFGSLFGGQGMGILPILLFAGLGFFLFRKFARSKQNIPPPGSSAGGAGGFEQPTPFAQPESPKTLEQGLGEILATDPSFDSAGFLEIASDCFFQVQAGWMRRDLASYRDLLGDSLASEYEQVFERMREKGVINKLESIAVRKVDMVAAGSTGGEDFITVLFKANLLDFTVDEATGKIVEGSDTQPVKFKEEWTWARPVGTNQWKLEGIEVVKE